MAPKTVHFPSLPDEYITYDGIMEVVANRRTAEGMGRGEHHRVVFAPDLDFARENRGALERICHEAGIPMSPQGEMLWVPPGPHGSRQLSEMVQRALAEEGGAERAFRRACKDKIGMEPTTLMPYANTTDVREATSRMNAELGLRMQVGYHNRVEADGSSPDLAKFMKDPFTRLGWGHPVPGLIENEGHTPFGDERLGYPTSFIGAGPEGARKAYEQLVAKTGKNEAYFKIVFSAGGFGVMPANSMKELDAVLDEMQRGKRLEEGTLVEVQESAGEILGYYSFQFEGQAIRTPGSLSRQLLTHPKKKNSWMGNVYNDPQMNQELVEQAKTWWAAFVGKAKERGISMEGRRGSFDFVHVQEDGKDRLLMLDPNCDREGGADLALAIAQNLNLRSDAEIRFENLPMHTAIPHYEAWRVIKENGMGFTRSEGGVLVPLWGEGESDYQSILVVGGHTEKMRDRVCRLLEQAEATKKNAPDPKPHPKPQLDPAHLESVGMAAHSAQA